MSTSICLSFFIYVIRFNSLSHTWVRSPGFRAILVSVHYSTWEFQDFPAIWLIVPRKTFGDLLLTKKYFPPKRCFVGSIKIPPRRIRPLKSLWAQFAPMLESTNKWKKKLKFSSIMGLAVALPQTVRHWLANEIFQVWKYTTILNIMLGSILNCFTSRTYLMILWESWINTQVVWVQFSSMKYS